MKEQCTIFNKKGDEGHHSTRILYLILLVLLFFRTVSTLADCTQKHLGKTFEVRCLFRT